MYKYIKHFKEISLSDVPLVGGKNASLGEMYQKLAPKGINLPNGLATIFLIRPASEKIS